MLRVLREVIGGMIGGDGRRRALSGSVTSALLILPSGQLGGGPPMNHGNRASAGGVD